MNKNEELMLFKTEYEGECIEYGYTDDNSEDAISILEDQIDEINKKLSKKYKKAENLTCYADKYDYVVAASVGVLTGALDSIFVDDFDLTKCNESGSKNVESLVKKLGKSNDLKKAIKNLENHKYNIFPSDPNLEDFSGGNLHHLNDFAHHPTLVGLACSILTQFTGVCYGTNPKQGFVTPKVIMNDRIGKSFGEKVRNGTIGWFIHLCSDMAGTSKSVGKGAGIPGPLLSLAKELSSTKLFKNIKLDDTSFSTFLTKLYDGTLFASHDEKGKIINGTQEIFDLRTEIGMIKNQMVPVLLNCALVRIFCSIRRFICEINEKQITSFSDIGRINWSKVSPYGNRTVRRMVTVSMATFEAVDFGVATVKSLIKSKGSKVAFAKEMIVCVNFVGFGKLALSLKKELCDSFRLRHIEKEINELLAKEIYLLDAKIYYKEADLWKEVENTQKGIEKLYHVFTNYIPEFNNQIDTFTNNLEESTKIISKLSNSDEEFKNNVKKLLGE